MTGEKLRISSVRVDTFCERIGVAYVDINSITRGHSVLPLTRVMWKVLLRHWDG
jgi:hypothetical protein